MFANDSFATVAFTQAVDQVDSLYGSYKVTWGEVHRIRHGQYDLPASGGPGALGCFRVLGFIDAEDGEKEVYRGDGWQFAVEFSDLLRPIRYYPMAKVTILNHHIMTIRYNFFRKIK